MPPGSARTVAIVPHTHWDREWYEPFETYRVKLVRMLDELLDLLEADPDYAHFLLDGQTAVVDDYLEVRPEAESRLEALARAGRLAVGPWMILMDEFMVSGETIVRNLQLGSARGRRLGRVLRVGYLPDMFGHVAQMPQILRLAGIEHAVVWRGVPEAIRRHAFWWTAPNGSRVRAEYLFGSYSNGRDLPDDGSALVERARDYERELGEAALPGAGLLLMNGTDHQIPQRWLGRVVAEANRRQSEYHFELAALDDYLEGEPVEGLDAWTGELRSGSRANVLMGVVSNRIDVKHAAAAAERALERRAEPLAALFLPPQAFPHRHLGLAWRGLVLNAAHDSSCACSADDVVDEVLVRYHKAEQIGAGVAQDVLDRLAFQIDGPPGAWVVLNATATPRSEVVEVDVPGTGPLHFQTAPDGVLPAQVREHPAAETFAATVAGSKTGWVLDMMRGSEFAGRPINVCSIDEDGPRVEVVAHAAAPGDPTIDLGSIRSRIAHLAADRQRQFRFRLFAAPRRTAWFRATDVPAFGWRTFTPHDGAPEHPPLGASACGASSSTSIHNDILSIEVDPSSATFTVVRDGVELAAQQRIVDGGDGGDTYNYAPPRDDRLVDTPDRVELRLLDDGPVRARIEMDASYAIPRSAEGNERSCAARSIDLVPLRVVTTIELRTGEPLARVGVTLHNAASDHRVRAHFPLPSRVTGSDAGCAFAVVRRGLETEGGPHEAAIPTFPARGFVDCGGHGPGLAVLHDGVFEYEVVNGGAELAVTLLRCTGYLSRREPSTRPNPAGPQIPVTGAQMQGVTTFDYALLPHRGAWHEADVAGLAHAFATPLELSQLQTVSTRERASSGALLEVRGAHLSALHRDADGRLIARVVNLSAEAGRAVLDRGSAPVRGRRVDLLGRDLGPFDAQLDLEPFEISTLRITEA